MPKFRKIDDVEIVASLSAGDSLKVSGHAGGVSDPDKQTRAGYDFWASFCEVIKEDRAAEKELQDSSIRRVLNELPRIRSQRTNALLAESNYAWRFALEKLAYFRPLTFKAVSVLASCLLIIGASMGLFFMEKSPVTQVNVMHDNDEITILSQNVHDGSVKPNNFSPAVRDAGMEAQLTLADRISQIDAGGTLVLQGTYREPLRITKPLRLTTTEAGGVRIGM